jgi:hypothetical protein
MIRSLLTKYAGINILTRSEMRDLCTLKYQDGLKAGKDIGILKVLRYNRETLSAAKFKESAREFDFNALDARYPFNPLLENPHAKAKVTAQG